MTFRKLLALVVFMAGCVEATAEQEDTVALHFDDAMIVSAAFPEAGSGVFHMWAVLTASLPNQDIISLYVTYFGEDQAFPAANSRCSIDAHEDFIQGLSANGAIDRDRPLLVPYFMECEGVIYRY